MRAWGLLSPGEDAVLATPLTNREEKFLDTSADAPRLKVIQSAIRQGLSKVARLLATQLASKYFFEHVAVSAKVAQIGRKVKAYDHDGPCTPLFSRGMCQPCYQHKYRQEQKRKAARRRKVAA